MGGDASMLAGLPALIALIVCLKKGPEYAFLVVYLPVLLLLPDDCRMPISGQFNFSDSAIAPIAVFYFWKEGRNWKWNVTDFLVLTFAALLSISQYVNTDYWLAQHLALRTLTTALLPYAIAKGMMVDERMSAETAKKIAIFAAFVAIVSVYEFRMTMNPFIAFLAPLFPGIGEVPSFRYGLARIRGPWGHPILAGIILAIAYRMARWLEWSDNWPGSVPLVPISKVRFCELALIGGSLMTISRGPWVGAGAGALVVMLLRSRHRSYATILAIFAVFILAVPVYNSFDAYVDVSRSGGRSEAQDSAAYRREMIQQYIVVAEERPTWGWGENSEGKARYPIINGMASIDNHYLLLALDFGVYSLASMVLILLWVPLRLLAFGLKHSPDEATTALSITFIGVLILIAVSISTAYLGAQTQPLLFLIAGWSEALLLVRQPMEAKVLSPVQKATYRFERVMV